eukprot:jgi/Botrbrau1/798/Bobra.0181s0051.1
MWWHVMADHHITKKQSVEMVNTLYDLITDCYECAWDTSVHFSCRHRLATFSQAQVEPGAGNPGRTIASLSGAHVTRVIINAYQVKRALHHTRKLEQVYKEVYRFLKHGAYFALHDGMSKHNFDPRTRDTST